MRIPRPWGLFQATEGFIQLTMICCLTRIFKSRRLLHILFFLKNTMDKCVLDIQLTKTPALRNCNRENQVNGRELHNRAERVIIVNAIALLESLSNEASFIPINRTIDFTLDLVDPLAPYEFSAGCRRNKMPRVVAHKSKQFTLHYGLPIWIS
jgi:hypothetical protein